MPQVSRSTPLGQPPGGASRAAAPETRAPEAAVARTDVARDTLATARPKVAAGGQAAPEWALPAVKRWWPQIQEVAREFGLDPHLLASQMQQESNGRPHLVSPAGAKGLMQLMPATARAMGVKDPFDPVQSLRGGARYLREQIQTFNGDTKLALAAYNAGPGNVRKYDGVPPFRETRAYVREILERMES
ncbi:MAG: transglycosylase SLT domain-containing protein [Candidatus Sericytochromatia bacterium]|nr:transglycosylase SLT domain-containing protein [Candidatus Sericytochromatia bacterium]